MIYLIKPEKYGSKDNNQTQAEEKTEVFWGSLIHLRQRESKLLYYVSSFLDVEAIKNNPTFWSSVYLKWSFLGTITQLEVKNNSTAV